MMTTYQNNDIGRVKASHLPAPQQSSQCAVRVKQGGTKAKKSTKTFVSKFGWDTPLEKDEIPMLCFDNEVEVRMSKSDRERMRLGEIRRKELADAEEERRSWLPKLKFKPKSKSNKKKNKIYLAQSLVTESLLTDVGHSTSQLHNWLYNGSHCGQSFLEHYVKIPSSITQHVSLLEDVCILGHSLLLSRNMVDRYVSVITFCKLRGSRLGFTSALCCVASDLFRTTLQGSEGNAHCLDSVYESIQKCVVENVEYSAQDEEFDNVFSEARAYIGMYEKLKETPIYKKLYKFLLYVLSLGLLDGINIKFDSLNFTKFEAEAIKRSHKPGFDMFHCMLDTICFVCDRGLQYFKTGNVSSIFHSGSSYERWISESNRILRESKFMSNPEPHGIKKFKFLSDLKDLIEQGKGIVKFTSGLDKFEKMTLQRILCDLQMVESNELTKKSAQMPRKDPFAVLIHGCSSICKSQLKQILFYHYGKVFGLPTTADYMYTRCPTDEYWSGFNSTQWCIVMDDIAFLKPNGEVDPTLKEMLQVKNSVPYVPPQAALEDKGRTPIRPELLIGTTNTKHLNLHAYFACPFAVARRMSYIITAKIKTEYSKHGVMADSSKIPPTPVGEYMNIWNFTISIPVPLSDDCVDNQNTKYVIVHEYDNINDLLSWFITEARAHDVSQTKALNADAVMMDVIVCNVCFRAQHACVCSYDAQTDEVATDNIQPEVQIEDVPVETNIVDELHLEDFSSMFKYKLWFVSKVLSHDVNEFNVDIDSKYAYCYGILLMYYILISMQYLYSSVNNFMLLQFFVISLILSFRYFWFILAHIYMYRFGDFWKLRVAHYVCGTNIESTRLIFRLAGQSVKRNLYSDKRLQIVLLFLSNAAVVAGLYKLYLTIFGMKPQASVGTVPVANTVEKPQFYYHNPYKNTGVEISGQSKCSQGDILLNKLRRNTVRLNFRFMEHQGKVHSTTGVNIKGNIWMFNKHALKGNVGTVDLIFEDTSQNVSRNCYNVTFSSYELQILPYSDLAFIEIRAVPPGVNLVPYFPKDKVLEGRYSGFYTLRDKSGDHTQLQINNIHAGTCPVFGIPGYHGSVGQDTQNGDCGSVCLARIGDAQVLLGSHTCGKTGKVFFQHISQKMLESIVAKYTPQVDCGVSTISAPGYERKIIDLHPKSSIRFLEQGNATVIGSFAGYRPKHKSKVVRTYIHPEVVKDGYDDSYGPPDMSWKPWHLAIKDMTAHTHTHHNSKLKDCEDAFFNDLVTKLGAKINDLQVYTQDVALNGVDGIAFVDRINCSTSAGNPFKKSKKFFMDIASNGNIESLDPVIQDRISLIEETYSRGERFHPQFCGHLKDEATPTRKVLAGKTRVFTGGEFAWMIVVRRFYLSHIRLIQNNPFVFEAMPGIVAQSKEWNELHSFITTFGEDRIVAGDYGKFDKKMVAAFILSAFEILIRLSQKAGWKEEDLLVLRCIAYDTAFPNVDFNGDYIEIQGNPSGHPLTVIINCLVNSLYMRYAYLLVSGKDVSTFQDNVKLATYGDDNIMGVSKDCPKFNHSRIAIAMKLIGVEYTMAEKEAESVPYIHIRDASFLKRKFVFDKDIGTVVAPLDPSSFDKMLTTCLKSDELAPEAHAICVIETALREYFFYGKEVYAAKFKYFNELVIRCNLTDWVRDSTFPDYNQLIRDFWMRFGDETNANKFAPGGAH